MMACIGEPVSWPRLEAFALDRRDDAIRMHVDACPVCARCLEEIRTDVVVLLALPALTVAERAPRRRWWIVPAMGFAVAALLALVLWPRDGGRGAARDVVAIKGVGDVVLGLVRERDGAIRDDATTFRAGDRWKVVVTCPPGGEVAVEVAIIDPRSSDSPLPPARIACGNRVVLPGAFSLTGVAANQICIRIERPGQGETPIRPGDPAVACTTVTPE
ncbi:MAG: hypothetical protein WKG01_08935 [Kofleriaceae bacterium]